MSKVNTVEFPHAESIFREEQIDISDKIKKKTSLWITMKKLFYSDKSDVYLNFKLKKGSSEYPIYICLIQTILMLFKCIIVSGNGVPLSYKIINYLALIVPMAGWLYIFLYRRYIDSKDLEKNGKIIIWVGNMCIISQALLTGLMSIIWVLSHDDCNSDACLQDSPDDVYPLELLFHHICGGIAMPLFYTCHHALSSFIAVFVTYATMTFTAILLRMDPGQIMYILLTAVVISMALTVYEGSVYANFTSYYKFENALRVKVASENKEYLMKVQTEEMRRMIGNVAHDLRTPLQAMQSEVENIRDIVKSEDVDNTKAVAESVSQLGRVCNFMNMIINRGIDFTKATSGVKLVPSIESTNLAKTLRWAVSCLVKSNSNVPIVIEPIPKSIHKLIYTDKHWLLENLLCLLSNAQKFTSEGDIRVRCSLHASVQRGIVMIKTPDSSINTLDSRNEEGMETADLRSGESERSLPMLLIEVEDTGIGISEEIRELLFRPFKQAQRKTGGTGLGLYSLAKRLESLGGLCGADKRSDGEGGSCFWFAIPYKPDDGWGEGGSWSGKSSTVTRSEYMSNRNIGIRQHDCAEFAYPPDSGVGIESMMSGFLNQDREPLTLEGGENVAPVNSYRHLRILLVDDSVLIRKTTSRSLIREGHHVQLAQNGADCLKILETVPLEEVENRFDVILMDLQMPVMDGMQATRRIRQLEKDEFRSFDTKNSRHITIIGFTANTMDEAQEGCMESGMDGFLEKPLTVTNFQKYLTSIDHGQVQC